jgi:zinc protease
MPQKFCPRFLLIVLTLSLAPFVAVSQSRTPSMKFTDRTLANGMRVLTATDHSSPTVAIQVWYHVGSKDDPSGRSGFAHLFEHIMFKSTKNMKSEMMDRLTEDVGGFNNAFTADDVTVYYEVVPSNYLETLIWAEADRMSGLNVDNGNFKSERDVVKEEFRQGVLAPPYGRFEFLLQQKSFVEHPYKRPGIGSIEDLDAASLTDVQQFHVTYYRPDNATVVVVGDFEQNQLDAWIDKYLAPIAKPSSVLPRVQVKEPPRKAEARFTEYGSNDLPAIGMTFLTPRQADPDSDALRLASTILSDGESSRLYRSLVYEQQLAAEVSSNAEFREDVSLFVVYAILSEGKKVEDVEQALVNEITKLQNTPVTLAELNKAKNQLITDELRERETSNGRAQALGEAAVLLANPNLVNTSLSRLQAVTAADIQRVMRKYFGKNNRVVLHYLPEAKKSVQGGDAK